MEPMNTNPETIGYWCGVYNLDIGDLLTEKDFEGIANWSDAAHEAYEAGLERAREELVDEANRAALAKLRESLLEAGTT
jgi:hypothetical protein